VHQESIRKVSQENGKMFYKLNSIINVFVYNPVSPRGEKLLVISFPFGGRPGWGSKTHK